MVFSLDKLPFLNKLQILQQKMTTNITKDERIKILFETVKEKRTEIDKATNGSWKTSCEFRYSPNSLHDKTDIRLVAHTSKIVEMYAFLIQRKKGVEDAAKQLGIPNFNFKWLGFTIEEWFEDFSIRVNQLTIETKKRELNEIELKLNRLISPELRAEMELNDIENFFNKEK